MKKLLLTLFTLGWVLAFSQTATLTIPNDLTVANAGDQVVVPITITENTPADGVSGFLYNILYDPAALTYVTHQNLHPNANAAYFSWNVPTPGDWRGNWLDIISLSSFTVNPGDVMIELVFTVNDDSYIDFTPAASYKSENGMAIKVATEMTTASFTLYSLTLNNGFVTVGAAAINWDGSEGTDWFDGDNWSGGAYPTIGDDVVIPNGMPNYPEVLLDPVLGEVALCNNITVEDAATLLIMPDGYMTVAGTFDNAGFVGILSDADFSGSLICADIQGLGSYQYWRYLGITGDPMDPTTGWHYLSSPTANFSLYNMRDYYVNTWDEPTSLWVQHVSLDPQTPCDPAPEITMSGMEGWSVKWDPMYSSYGCPNPGTMEVVEFIGPYNTGDQTATITNLGPNVDYAGFNMVGNPYPSYWNYDQFYGGVNFPTGQMFDAIYFWDEGGPNGPVYASYIWPISTNGGSPYVPPAQAFFFEAIDPAVGLTFTQNEQAHITGLPYWKNEVTDLVKLKVFANGSADETAIRFNETATVNRDLNDARKLFNGGNAPNLYTIGGNVELSINQLPAADVVPVYFKCNASGTYEIEAVETSDFSILILEDKLTGEQTDLLASNYSFEYTQGSNADRFNLHFKSTGIGENEAAQISIWSGDSRIYVQTPLSARGDIVVYNMMGQEVVRTDIEPGLNTINMNEVNANFVVKVFTSYSAVTGKVFVR